MNIGKHNELVFMGLKTTNIAPGLHLVQFAVHPTNGRHLFFKPSQSGPIPCDLKPLDG